MAPQQQQRTKVFVSYSHRDADWLERLRIHLKPLERNNSIEVWDDTRIKPGSKWKHEIEKTIDSAKVVVLLVSADFLASEFITANELPPVLNAAEQEGALILPVILSPSRFSKTKSLSQFQAVNDPSKPLINLTKGEQEEVFVKLADDIETALTDLGTSERQELLYEPNQRQRRSEADVTCDQLSTPQERYAGAKEHLSILMKGTAVWNRWRKEHPEVFPDLRGAELSDADFIGANFSSADLSGAKLNRALLSRADLREAILRAADLIEADLSKADLSMADLHEANLSRVDLSEADLVSANLHGVNLRQADLREANLSNAILIKADLQRASLVMTNLEQANLSGCSIYGISAWNLRLSGANQSNLIITLPDELTITVDSLEVAQFMYLLVYNEKIRDVFNSLTSKVVLILGRFTQERKVVLDAIREKLRQHDYLPVLFDFEKPANRDTTETISTLAYMSRFIIADITGTRSIPQELQSIVPGLAVPVQPLLQSTAKEYAMFDMIRKYPWVLETYHYNSPDDLMASLEEKVIAPAEAKIRELQDRRALL